MSPVAPNLKKQLF